MRHPALQRKMLGGQWWLLVNCWLPPGLCKSRFCLKCPAVSPGELVRAVGAFHLSQPWLPHACRSSLLLQRPGYQVALAQGPGVGIWLVSKGSGRGGVLSPAWELDFHPGAGRRTEGGGCCLQGSGELGNLDPSRLSEDLERSCLHGWLKDLPRNTMEFSHLSRHLNIRQQLARSCLSSYRACALQKPSCPPGGWSPRWAHGQVS